MPTFASGEIRSCYLKKRIARDYLRTESMKRASFGGSLRL
jgi:hypothetical protein